MPCFSPLHEGDTSVAPWSWRIRKPTSTFQSPSRGGHLCGYPWRRAAVSPCPVSVPFTRGTPLWPTVRAVRACSFAQCFSPLHEGDTSVAMRNQGPPWRKFWFQSPSRGGHLCGAAWHYPRGRRTPVSVPFTRGTPLWRCNVRGAMLARSHVSVPFTRGTPLWPLLHVGSAENTLLFQSPSRGGHLCGALPSSSSEIGPIAFQSPSRGGHLCGDRVIRDALCESLVSVPFTRGTPLWPSFGAGGDATARGFSPLHEGDTSVASCRGCADDPRPGFQSPSRGGHLCGRVFHGLRRLSFSPLHEGDTSVASQSLDRLRVSVPFTRGTPLWPVCP